MNCAFWRTLSQLSALSTFYNIMLKGLPHGTMGHVLETEAVGEQLYKDGTLGTLLTDSKKVDEYYEMMKQQKEQLFKKMTDDAKGALDATAIVCAHGILDASVYMYLQAFSLASPESFRIYTGKKQVTLSNVESKSYEHLHAEKIREFMEGTVEKNSLIYKLDKLHEVAQPKNTQMNPDHKYDRERLVQFDKARHDIVHGNDWSSRSIDFTTEFFYWNLLNFYLLRVVAEKTGLKLSTKGSRKYFA